MRTVLNRIFLCCCLLSALAVSPAGASAANRAWTVTDETVVAGALTITGANPVCQGGVATLFIATDGVGSTYDHLEKQDVGELAFSTVIAGVTVTGNAAAGYTITDANPVDGRKYRVVELFLGALFTPSNAVTINVTPMTPAPITPVAPVTASSTALGAYCLGSTVAFTTTPGSTLAIVPTGGGNGIPNQGAQSIFLNAPGTASVFSFVVGCKNGVPNANITSPLSTIIQIDNPGVLTPAPGSMIGTGTGIVCENSTANFAAQATGAFNGVATITYSAIPPPVTVSNTGIATFPLGYSNYPPLGTLAQITANGSGCRTGGAFDPLSLDAPLTAGVAVAKAPTAALVQANQTICKGTAFTLTTNLDNPASTAFGSTTTINFNGGAPSSTTTGQNPVQVTVPNLMNTTTFSIASVSRTYTFNIIPLIAITCAGTVTPPNTSTATVIQQVAATVSISSSSPTICVPGGTVTLTANSTDPNPGPCQWFKNGVAIAGATANTLAVSNAPLVPDVYTVACFTACGQILSAPFSLITSVPPTITGPQSITVCAGAPASFAVNLVTGTGPFAFQWFVNRNDGNGFVAIPGATNPTFNIAAATQAMNGFQYRATVTGACAPPATSVVATLTVNPITVITQQPVNQSVCLGMPATFTVAFSGTQPCPVQWFGPQGLIAGATGNTLTINPTTLTSGGGYFAVVSCVCGTVTSNTALLTVKHRPTTVLSTAGATTICAGGSVPLQVLIGSTGPGNATGPFVVTFSDGQTFTGVGTNPFQYIASPAASTTYTVTNITGANGCSSIAGDNTGAVAVTVNPITAITVQPVSKTVCQNGATTLSVTAVGGNLAYQWRANGVAIFNANGATYTPPTAAAGTTTYDVVVVGSCGIAVSNQVTVTVYPTPVGGTVLGGGITVCGIGNAGVLTLTGYSGTIVKWQKSTDGGATWIDADNAGSATFTFSNLTVTTWYRAVVASDPAGTLCIAVSTVATVNVSGATNGGFVSGNHNVCIGQTVTLTLTGAVGTVQKWQYADNSQGGNGVWTDIPGTAGALSITAASFHSFVQTWYRACVTSGQCNVPIYSKPIDGIDQYGFKVTPVFCFPTGPFAGFGGGNSGSDARETMITNVYPTPTHGLTTLEVTTTVDGKVTLEVYDLLGRAMIQKTHNVYAGSNNIPVDMTELNNGVYLIRVTDDKAKINTVKVSKF